MNSFTRIASLLPIGMLTMVGLYCAGLRPNPQFAEPQRVPAEEEATSDRTSQTDVGVKGPAIAADLDPGSSELQVRVKHEIDAYLGVPYRWGGSNRYGMDCSGFVSTVYRSALGVALPRMVREMFDLGNPVDKNDLSFGELVFFEKAGMRGVSHVGIYIGNGQFAHASMQRGVIISSLNEKYYRRRFVGAKRILQDPTN